MYYYRNLHTIALLMIIICDFILLFKSNLVVDLSKKMMIWEKKSSMKFFRNIIDSLCTSVGREWRWSTEKWWTKIYHKQLKLYNVISLRATSHKKSKTTKRKWMRKIFCWMPISNHLQWSRIAPEKKWASWMWFDDIGVIF